MSDFVNPLAAEIPLTNNRMVRVEYPYNLTVDDVEKVRRVLVAIIAAPGKAQDDE